MPNHTHTPITTAHDLAAVLRDVPPERRVVVMLGGVVVPCELVAKWCGDWLVLEIAQEVTSEQLS